MVKLAHFLLYSVKLNARLAVVTLADGILGTDQDLKDGGDSNQHLQHHSVGEGILDLYII